MEIKKLALTNLFLRKYQEMNWEETKSIGSEVYLLTNVREYLEWSNYTDEEKHEKRKVIFSVIKKTGNKEEFAFETTIIDLYEICKKILFELNEFKENDLIVRLAAMLNVLTIHINEQRDMRSMKLSSFPIILNIARQCMQKEYLISLHENLSELITLLEKLTRMVNTGR